MLEILSRGGFFTYLILLWAAVLYGAVFRTIVNRDAGRLPTLRGATVGMVLLGVAGSCLGLVEAGAVVGELTVVQWRSVLTIAPIPLAVAAIAAVPASVLIGIAGGRSSGEAQRTGADGAV